MIIGMRIGQKFGHVLLATSLFLTPAIGFAQGLDDNQGGAIEMTDSGTTPVTPTRNGAKPRVGRDAARKYMGARGAQDGQTNRSPAAVGASGEHYLAVHLGTFVSDNSYKWGVRDSDQNVGRWNLGVTYRVGEWVNSMDLTLRVDLAGYNLSEGRATKLAFLPMVTFPDASSKFPLYFGAGAGLGVFVNQIPNESSLTIDYQLLAGARFFEVFTDTGFFVEAGLKNHLFLLSDGQFNGTFVAVGSVFTF